MTWWPHTLFPLRQCLQQRIKLPFLSECISYLLLFGNSEEIAFGLLRPHAVVDKVRRRRTSQKG